MDLLQQRMREAQQRYANARWRLKMENQRTTENVKCIISYSRKIQACQERLRETNEASRAKTEKLQLVYKNIELHGQIVIIRDGLSRAMELTARAERKINKVSDELECMREERLDIGIDENNNAEQFGAMESPNTRRVSLEAMKQEFHDSQYREFVILRKKMDVLNTRIEIAGEKFAALEMRKQELLREIQKYKTRKHDVLKAKTIKENLQSANLRLFLVELGAI